jgi:hypothetical protein
MTLRSPVAGSPVAGVHYPGNLAAMRSWFPDDAACLDYLDWLRWPDGFCCLHCGAPKGQRLSRRPGLLARLPPGGLARQPAPGTTIRAVGTGRLRRRRRILAQHQHLHLRGQLTDLHQQRIDPRVPSCQCLVPGSQQREEFPTRQLLQPLTPGPHPMITTPPHAPGKPGHPDAPPQPNHRTRRSISTCVATFALLRVPRRSRARHGKPFVLRDVHRYLISACYRDACRFPPTHSPEPAIAHGGVATCRIPDGARTVRAASPRPH